MKRLLNAELYKLRLYREYGLFVISCFTSAVLSVIIIKILGDYIFTIPEYILERMTLGNTYNFGFIQVNSLSELHNMTPTFVISSAFKNYCPTVGVAIFISIYIRKEFSYGGIRNVLLKGFARKDVLNAKIAVLSLGVAVAIILYFLGYVITSIIVFGADINLSLFDTLVFLILQMLISITFAVFCVTVSICYRGHLAIFVNGSMVVAGTLFINNIMVFTQGRINLSKYWILDYSFNMTPNFEINYRELSLALFLTVGGAYFIAKRFLNRIQFE